MVAFVLLPALSLWVAIAETRMISLSSVARTRMARNIPAVGAEFRRLITFLRKKELTADGGRV
jgi:hypothetical protein